MRKEFQMTDDQYKRLINACKPVPAMYLSCGQPMFGTPQENANRAWRELGNELGFDYTTVRPVPGKSSKYFTAEEK